MKKIASLLLAVVMLVSLASGMGISAFAATALVTEDGIRYAETGENTVKIVGYSGKGENVVIPDTISGKKVTRISNFSFNDNTIVKSLSVPANVTEIDDMVILNCPNITAIKVASDNKYYDSRNNCNAIIEKATGNLIAGCKTTKVPNGVTRIGRYTFFGCSGLTDITLPESVKSIQHQAFQDCKNLKNITFLNKNCKICELCNPGDKTCDFTIVKGAAIHGYKGSTAEKYAKEYGRKFVALTQLSTPALKVTVNTNGTFKLSWNKVTGAEKYELYIKQANGSYKLMKTTTSTSFTTAFATYGKQFSYKMRAVTSKNKSAASAYSSVVNAKNTKKLQTPTLKVTVNSNGTFKLSWNKVTGATSYQIYMKQANGSYKLIKTTSSTSFTTAVASKGKTYSYKIRAVTSKNKNAASNYSNVVSAKRK